MKTRLILLLTLAFSTALFAQAPAPSELIPADFKRQEDDKLIVPIPPGTKNLLCSATISAPDYKAMPIRYGVGVWFQFQNDEGKVLKPSGEIFKSGIEPGFALGVERKTTKPKADSRKVAVPPGATKLWVHVCKYSQGSGYHTSVTGDFTVDAVSVKPVP